MLSPRHAVRAYETNSGFRSVRAQEAEIFRHASAGLRRARSGSSTAQTRALADNERLWTMVVGLVRDPANALPPPLRAGIASVGLAVLRDMQNRSPDFEFLIAVNEDIAAGLTTTGVTTTAVTTTGLTTSGPTTGGLPGAGVSTAGVLTTGVSGTGVSAAGIAMTGRATALGDPDLTASPQGGFGPAGRPV